MMTFETPLILLIFSCLEFVGFKKKQNRKTTCVLGGLDAHSVSAWAVNEFQINLLVTTVPFSLPLTPNQHFISLTSNE